MLTKSGDEVGIRGVQAADLGAHLITTVRQAFAAGHAPARPAVRNPKSWLSRKPELDVTVGRGGARCPNWGAAGPRRLVWALSESRQPALLSRFRSTAVSRLDAVVEVGGRCSLRGAAAGVCVVSVPAAPCVGDCWVAGRELGTVSVGVGVVKAAGF